MIDILSEWNLQLNGLVAATTDSGANIVLATGILNLPHVPCFSHTLQQTIDRAVALPQNCYMLWVDVDILFPIQLFMKIN